TGVQTCALPILVSGGSLQDRLSDGPAEAAEAARIGREVLSALCAAHAVGILHRDVKPANVLLQADGRSILTDFGIAALRESSGLTATGALIGSPEYMAPERIQGHEGDPASDLWSLGMLLYVAVEGRHPLRRATPLATLAAVLNQEVPPPERAGALAPVLSALLNRDPAARPDPETLDRMLAAATPNPSSHADLAPPTRARPAPHRRPPPPGTPRTPPPPPQARPPPARHSPPPQLVVPGRRVLLRLTLGRSFLSRPAVPRWRFVLRRVPERCSVLRLADPGRPGVSRLVPGRCLLSRLALSGWCSALRPSLRPSLRPALWPSLRSCSALRLAIPGRPRVPRRAGFRVL